MIIMDKEYKILLERSVRNEEQMINAVDSNKDVAKAISDNLENLNVNVTKLNDRVHTDIEVIKTYFMNEQIKLLKWIKYLALLLFVVLGTFAGLNVAGLL